MHRVCFKCLRDFHKVSRTPTSGFLHPSTIPKCSHRAYSQWYSLSEETHSVDDQRSELQFPSAKIEQPTSDSLPQLFTRWGRRSLHLNSFIPTRVDYSEAGGLDLVDESDILFKPSTQFGVPSAYNYDALLANVEETNFEQEPSERVTTEPRPAKPSPIGRPKQGVRGRLASLRFHSPSPSIATALPLPIERFEVQPNRTEEVLPAVLMAAVHSNDMRSVRNLLSENGWPTRQLNSMQVAHLFQLIVQQAVDSDECWDFVRDYAASSRFHTLPPLTWLQLATRIAVEDNVGRAVDAIASAGHTFTLKDGKVRALSARTRSAARALWRVACGRADLAQCQRLYEVAVKEKIVEPEAAAFMREALVSEREKGASLSSLSTAWKQLGQRYGSEEAGLDVIMEAACSEEEQPLEQSLEELGSLCRLTVSIQVESLLAHLVVALLKENRIELAKKLLSCIVISGKHFGAPLRLLAEEANKESLLVVERLATVVGESVFGESRRRGRQAAAAKVTPSHEDSVEGRLEKVLSSLSGAGDGKGRKKKKWIKPGDKKKVKMDEKQLHILGRAIHDTWKKLGQQLTGAEKDSCMERLHKWANEHSLRVEEETRDKLPSSP